MPAAAVVQSAPPYIIHCTSPDDPACPDPIEHTCQPVIEMVVDLPPTLSPSLEVAFDQAAGAGGFNLPCGIDQGLLQFAVSSPVAVGREP